MQNPSKDTQKFILKFFPEIMIKGSSAKRQMVGQLYTNLVTLLGRIDVDIKVRKYSDKIEILTPLSVLPEVRITLINTSGIEQILEVLQFDDMDTLDKIKVKVGEIVAESLKEKSFVVRAKRSGTHSFKSTELESTVGGYLLAHSDASRVDLSNPEVTVRLELIESQLNIITTKYKGLSGFPIGTQGDILSLMSGGFDSTVASYLTMKRGIKTHFIFFNLGGMAHEIGVKQVALYLWSKFGASHRVKFISVPFDDVLTEIFRSTAPTYMGVTLKRLMLMASEKVADSLEIDALLTGESVAQVSSQTLRNLALIDQVSNKLILRPLSTMNKPEIISIAGDIGTRHFAESMPEYCGVISQNPITHGSFKRMEREAKKFNYEVLNKAVEDAQHIYVDEIVDDISKQAPIEVVSDLTEGNFTIIDIRAEDVCIETSCECIKIPFHKLKTEFDKLPQDKEYLLYCEKGIMSQLHAQYLRDAKKSMNVRVYRP
ncbi:MAG: tRNA 4-thiouridine(8) synthase ThiI [Epsilonproteobacteria bacterium]|nr:tRNA 4-thiouridine(8) synthase ThiI [Campylobacterota bacterium]OIO15587.1 MAG: tRNA 4-thiouridine(8) synthase ThiI [Helicobacteraceae bacterium CG1_02_36_14]PIP09409.1 MAG: tRNA 4-thiouridine(8) synthase ThiI [Sulfurimonas sp. CG23_combo_of_CG06-09_8_20_14_all_36_33]PIS26325.1 MAG: tRNA 4-thiouridine(8) synthase ThiI [Sulfurimonas sp. CG08_land_8_20_14_0_20_36_33]PIU33724.1 MAG: tRNA 4-thiouridine(8) synthase ThiI [Sulfurimonas sp. CG07_land_8_20_14_0_80_36_56]PIV04772.1 MAG: tRNA 4-thiour